MRSLRWMVGLLALLVAIPAAAAGVAAWWVMRHPSPDGAFHADLAPIERADRVLVVPDLDALLRRDAPYVRVGQTTLRLSASSGGTPAFLGVAEPGQVAAYLAGVRYTELAQVQLGRGVLPVRTARVDAQGGEPGDPQAQGIWQRQGLGSLSWRPSEDRSRRVALVIVLRDGTATAGPHTARLEAALHADWLGTASWGLLIFAIAVLTLGFVLLAWPGSERKGPFPSHSDEQGPLLNGALPASRVSTVEFVRVGSGGASGGGGGGPADRRSAPIVPGLARDRAAEVTAAMPGPGAVEPRAAGQAWPGSAGRTARLPLQPVAPDELPWAGLPHRGAPPVAGVVFRAGAHGGPAPVAAPSDLVWPPRRPAEPPATAPVREVVTEQLPPVPYLPRPACTLRLDRDRLAAR
ncbi:hypothetical protein QEZ54_06435 [Catellatospora sp. KI3]|uniref:hypothetical protein n=1 Tax=Catellatospora sp. KI3 TaxID=3041620 RepID=UPI002482C8B5|nr:hypothetical protein [Catellatospora sp. KI3]MDI1460597.1 hypothetical protein [Catellatospora sp. KI3]